MTRTKKRRRTTTRKTTSRRSSGNRTNKTGPLKLEIGTQNLDTSRGGWSVVLTPFVQSHQERKQLLRSLTARLQFLSDLSVHGSTPFCPRVGHLIQLVG